MGLTKSGEMPADFEADFRETWKAAFSNIIKPEKKQSWENESPKWFVLDQSVESKRKPGESQLINKMIISIIVKLKLNKKFKAC